MVVGDAVMNFLVLSFVLRSRLFCPDARLTEGRLRRSKLLNESTKVMRMWKR